MVDPLRQDSASPGLFSRLFSRNQPESSLLSRVNSDGALLVVGKAKRFSDLSKKQLLLARNKTNDRELLKIQSQKGMFEISGNVLLEIGRNKSFAPIKKCLDEIVENHDRMRLDEKDALKKIVYQIGADLVAKKTQAMESKFSSITTARKQAKQATKDSKDALSKMKLSKMKDKELRSKYFNLSKKLEKIGKALKCFKKLPDSIEGAERVLLQELEFVKKFGTPPNCPEALKGSLTQLAGQMDILLRQYELLNKETTSFHEITRADITPERVTTSLKEMRITLLSNGLSSFLSEISASDIQPSEFLIKKMLDDKNTKTAFDFLIQKFANKNGPEYKKYSGFISAIFCEKLISEINANKLYEKSKKIKELEDKLKERLERSESNLIQKSKYLNEQINELRSDIERVKAKLMESQNEIARKFFDSADGLISKNIKID